MSDTHLQELERQWKRSAAPADEAALLREQVRVGTLRRRDLELAAQLDHPAARLAAPEFALPPGYRTWISALGAWGDRFAFRAYTLALSAWAGEACPEHRDYYATAAAELARGDVPTRNSELAQLTLDHGVVNEGKVWFMVIHSLRRPRRYLPAEHPELEAATRRLRARFLKGPPERHSLVSDESRFDYTCSERRSDGWVHRGSLLTPGHEPRPVPPIPASLRWDPGEDFLGAPPGVGILDGVPESVPDTLELRAAVRDALLPEILQRTPSLQ